MTLDDFMAVTEERLPRAEELIAVCKEVGVSFGIGGNGSPVLKYQGDNRQECELLVKLIRREPWRSQVIASTGLHRDQPKEPSTKTPREFLWRDGHTYTEDARDANYGTGYPTGSWWWRASEDAEWQAVPGTGGEREQPPLSRKVM